MKTPYLSRMRVRRDRNDGIFLSVIIPAYNEETNIRLGALDKVLHFLERQKFTWEVIISDDGSTDASSALLDTFAGQNKGFRILHNPHRGKAGTVVAGVKEAKGSIVLFSDLDQATPLSELAKLLPFFDQKYDVVIGSRSSHREGAPLSRIIMARGFMLIKSIVLGLGITDTQCGFKAFTAEAAKRIVSGLKLYGNPSETEGSKVTAGFDVELLFLAKSMGYRIREVPVEWHYVETRRVNPVTDSLHGLRDVLLVRWNAMRGEYAGVTGR